MIPSLVIFPLAIIFLLAAFINCSSDVPHPAQRYDQKLLCWEAMIGTFWGKVGSFREGEESPSLFLLCCCCCFCSRRRQPSCSVKAIFLLGMLKMWGKDCWRQWFFLWSFILRLGRKPLIKRGSAFTLASFFFPLWREYVFHQAVVNSWLKDQNRSSSLTKLQARNPYWL